MIFIKAFPVCLVGNIQIEREKEILLNVNEKKIQERKRIKHQTRREPEILHNSDINKEWQKRNPLKARCNKNNLGKLFF